MKKVLSFTLVSLALAALSAPTFAANQGGFSASIRGDAGMLGSQVPYLTVNNSSSVGTLSTYDAHTHYSKKKNWDFDFTGRVAWYMGCSPCNSYIAASWQGGNHKHSTLGPAHTQSAANQAIIHTRALPSESYVGLATDMKVVSAIKVENKLSKTKLGFGLDLATCCPSFTLTPEFGVNYVNAKLNTWKSYAISSTVTRVNGNDIVSVPGLAFGPVVTHTFTSRDPAVDSYTWPLTIHERERTEGLGLYASLKGEYKFASSCWGNCFSVYAKAEVADIIGKQSYDYDLRYPQLFAAGTEGAHLEVPELYAYQEHPANRYSNIVEVDLEAALVYSPCFKCWDNMNMQFALGVRTDSYVNLFAHPSANNHSSILSLTRPTVFLEVGIKV